MFALMTTWRKGVDALRQRLLEKQPDPEALLAQLRSGEIARVPGTVVFMARSGRKVPPALVRHLAQFKALQQTVVSLNVQFEEVPRIPIAQRAEVHHVADGFWQITLRFGFVEIPNVPSALACARQHGCDLELDEAVYVAAHDAVVRRQTKPRLNRWRRALFSVMYRNAVRTPDRFDLPADHFIEITRQIGL